MPLMNMICGVIALLSSLAAVQADHRYTPGPVLGLPGDLSEISGLVAVDDRTVLAHNDEVGEVFSVNVGTGETSLFMRLGTKTVRADFEGITLLGPYVYLVTSDGLLFEARREGAGITRRYNIYDTGLGDVCEIEGLGTSNEGDLLLLCKRAAPKDELARLRVFRWHPDKRLQPAEEWIDVAAATFMAGSPSGRDLTWTGIERDPRTDGYLILSSRGHVAVSLSADGTPLGVMPLSVSSHPQAEGIALLQNGTLVIADEGGKAAGRLTTYRPL
ncbi:MAG: hypothetical protein AAF830_11480 [Pseudomonadota bacterium]